VSRAQAESNKNTSKSSTEEENKKDGNENRSNAQYTHPVAEARVVPGTPSRSRMRNCQSRPDQGSPQERQPRKKTAEIPETRLFHMQKCPIHVSHYAPSHAMHQKRTDCLCLPALSCGPGGDCPKIWVQFRRERESRSITDREKVPAASLICNPQDTYVQPKVVILALLHYAALCCRTMRCFIAPTITAGPAPPIGTLDSIGPLLDPGPARQEASLGHVADLACIGTVRPFDTCLAGHRP
jgi:hypothetical protein